VHHHQQHQQQQKRKEEHEQEETANPYMNRKQTQREKKGGEGTEMDEKWIKVGERMRKQMDQKWSKNFILS